MMRLHKKELWWGSLGVILILAAALRLLIYDYSLPYVDHPDEPTLYLGGQQWRGLFDLQPPLTGYPPAYIALNVAVQYALGATGIQGLAPTIRVLRLLSAAANLITLLLIMLTARRIAGDVAGITAGVLWTIAPSVLQYGVYAVADPFVYLFVALALWLAVVALLDSRRQWWCVLSVGAGTLAILFKYPAIPAILPGLLVGLNISLKKRQIRLVIIQLIILAAVGGWLVFVYQGGQFSSREADSAKIEGIQHLLDIPTALQTTYDALTLIMAGPVLVVYVGGAVAFFWAIIRHSDRAKSGPVGLVVLITFLIPWVANVFNTPGIFRIKDVLPATDAACVLFGVAATQIVATGRPLLRHLRVSPVVLTTVPILLIGLPQINASVQLVKDLRRPDWRVDLRQWADINLEPGTFIVYADNHKTFNPYYSGLVGQKWFDWWVTADFMEHPVSEWRDQLKMSYAALPLSEVEVMQQTPAGRDALAQMLHLRDFVSPPDKRGPQVSVFRLWKMEVAQPVRFGDVIEMLGYDSRDATRGGKLSFRFYWQPIQRPAINYSVFIHLLDDHQKLVSQADGTPASADRPTSTWDDAGETIIGVPFEVAVPSDMPTGTYHVMVGLYDSATGTRLQLPNGADSLDLMMLTIP